MKNQRAVLLSEGSGRTLGGTEYGLQQLKTTRFHFFVLFFYFFIAPLSFLKQVLNGWRFVDLLS